MTIIPGGKVTTEEVVHSNVIFDEALVRLLVKKGLITEAEIIAEIQAVKEDMEKRSKERRRKEQ